MTTPMNEPIESSDVLVMTLLSDLAALDGMDSDAGFARQKRVDSALNIIKELVDLGGGSLGLEKLTTLQAALQQETA